MLIGFDQIPETHVVGPKGGKGDIYQRTVSDDFCRIVRGCLAPGGQVGLHTHEKDSEIIYILSGTGKVLCDGVYEPLEAGSCHYCPKGHEHSLINDSEGDLCFLAVIPLHEV